jgi:hypothetical protein
MGSSGSALRRCKESKTTTKKLREVDSEKLLIEIVATPLFNAEV